MSLLANFPVSDASHAATYRHLALMREFAEALGHGHFEERSDKWRPAQWSSARRLVGIPLQQLDMSQLQKRLPTLLESLGMPSRDQGNFLAASQCGQRPHYLHLGVEEQRCKVYWETPMPSAPPTQRFSLYRAWKWQAGEPAADCSDYVLACSAEEARRWINDQLKDMPEPLGDLVEHLEIQFALKQVSWPPISVRIEEHRLGQATPRHSINLHVHAAQMPLGRIAGPLFGLARHWQLGPRMLVQRWLGRYGDKLLSNISLGVDHLGRPFFTCYYGGHVAKRPNQEY
ncbi:hypothetical protein [Vreelandella subterranea]|nr:hypothetical protein [Halomonas subterranea]